MLWASMTISNNKCRAVFHFRNNHQGCLKSSRIVFFGRENFREQIYSIKLDCLANSCDTNFEQHSQANTQCQLLIPNSGLLWLFFSSIGCKHSKKKYLLGLKDLLVKKTFGHKSQENPKSTYFTQINLLQIHMNLSWIKGET